MSAAKLWIKICANTSAQDALLAAEAGADAVGFVFAPSSRRVTVEQVATIVPALPLDLEKIGVFVDAGFDEIAAAVTTCGLTGAQLHFEAPAELPGQLRARFGPELRIVRTVHFESTQDANVDGMDLSVKGTGFSPYIPGKTTEGALAPEAIFSNPHIDAVLVDSRTPKATGGTGVTFDWNLAATTLFQNSKARKCIAAGGLTPANVAEAIAILRPWGVDVASGVEAAPGRKDPAKLRDFIANVRGATR